MSAVWAVVPTHDRRELLLACLAGLRAQTHPLEGIVVVDNASGDGSGEAAAAVDGVRVLRLATNSGSAGGFAAGVEAARATGADWLWLMDDDAEPERDALERLLVSEAASDPGTAALCGTVLGPDGRVDVLHRGFVARLLRPLDAAAYRDGGAHRVGFSSYVGLLVRGDVARSLEPPRADFYAWCDDVEYSLRIRSRGAIRLVPDSRVTHKAWMGGVATRRSRFWNRVLGLSYSSAPLEDFWKSLSQIRNFTWIKYRYGPRAPGMLAWIVTAYAVKSLLYEDRPLRRIPWIVRAAVRGRRGAPLGLDRARWAEICRAA